MFWLAPAFAAPTMVPTPIENAGALAPYFAALDRAKIGSGVARALHYGDSTIAHDGITRTVRDRLVAEVGDAGPGFVTAACDGRWNLRSDVVCKRAGDWDLKTILFGGAGGRYGLGGIVGILRGGSWTIGRAGLTRAEVWYQSGVGYGSLVVTADGVEVGRASAVAGQTEDQRAMITLPAGFTSLRVSTLGVVPLYGVVLETGKAGATYESLGVTGVGSKSFTTFAKTALAEQVKLRGPDLIVVQLGGNEAGYPILLGDGGSGYAPIFAGALNTIRAGKPEAACLVVTPLDQGERDELTGEARSKPGMPNLVAQQRAVALDQGCAFWNLWGAMGGKGSALTWGNSRGYGTGDLVHVTPLGLERLGNALADALMEAWRAG